MLADKKLIGLCCACAHKEPIRPILASLCELIKESGIYRMVIFQCFEDLHFTSKNCLGASSVFDMINYDMPDVMIVFPNSIKNDEICDRIQDNCAKHNIPLISVDSKLEGAFNVMYDYGEAFGQIVEHIITEHNCVNIKMMAGMKGNEFSQERIASCARIMKEHGLELKESDILYGDFWDTPTYKAMDEFFARGEEIPDAFVCANDSMAIAVCLKLNEHGYSVPEDVIVTGHDGIAIEEYHSPRLTTAIRDDNELASAILSIIDSVTLDGGFSPCDTVLKYKPVFSQSCGCRKSDGFTTNHQLLEYVKSYTFFRDFEEHINEMRNRLASEPTLNNAGAVFRKFAFDNTTICLTDKFYKAFADDEPGEVSLKHTPGEYSDKMYVMMSKRSDGVNIDNRFFDTSEILPGLENSFGEFGTIYIIPLNSQDNVMGYIVFQYSTQHQHSEWLYSFTMSFASCLETVNIHERMRSLNRRLEFLFTHDQLTKIYNRYGFSIYFTQLYEKAGESRDAFIVSIDLNDMKYINDNFGHLSGDEALCIVASSLTEAARDDEDIVCSRFGGDEFVVARMCDGNAKELAAQYHERFDEILARFNDENDKPFKITVSIGIHCSSVGDNVSVEQLIELADKLMYSDKAKHKRYPRNMLL